MKKKISSRKCFCAFCRQERRIYSKKHISSVNFFLAGLFSVLVMSIFWQKWEARVLFVFVVFLIVAEVFIQVRWRLTLPCPYCHFDPVLYLKNPDQAAAKVKRKLEISLSGLSVMSVHNPWTHLRPLLESQRKSQRSNKKIPKPTLSSNSDLHSSAN